MFGKTGDERVLLPESPPQQIMHDYSLLRKKLDSFNEDWYVNGYSPHVTTDTMAEVVKEFDRYSFCRGDEELSIWR